MRTVPYKSVLRGVLAREGGGNLANVAATDTVVLKVIEYISDRFRSAWEYYAWPEIYVTTQRYFLDAWSGAADYAAGDKVWFPGYAPIVVSGAGSAAANGTYYAVGELAGDQPIYYRNGDTADARIELVGASWILYLPVLGEAYGSAEANNPWDEVWGTIDASNPAPEVTLALTGAPYGAGYYQAIATAAGQSPIDADYWAAVDHIRHLVEFSQAGQTVFDACVAAWDKDPESDASAVTVPFRIVTDGVLLPPDYAFDSIWLRVRKACPPLLPVVYDAAATYAVGVEVYFDAIGDVYKCVTSTSAGETPATAAAKWELVPFPMIFSRAVKAGALADWQRSDGEGSAVKTRDSEERFIELLDEQVWQLTKLQGQTGRLDVRPASGQF